MQPGAEEIKQPARSSSKSTRIPRPPNAFMLFANDNRKKLATQFPHDSNKDISCRLGQQWKSLEAYVKEHYFEMAKTIDQEHKRKYPDYVYNPKEARLRKAMRESNGNLRRSISSVQKSSAKKGAAGEEAEGLNSQKPVSFVQILQPNSWMPMQNLQHPNIWIQYHPSNVQVPKAVVLVPPRVVSFNPQKQNQGETAADPSTQIVLQTKDDGNKIQTIPCSVVNVGDISNEPRLTTTGPPVPEKVPLVNSTCFASKPNSQVVYSNPAVDFQTLQCPNYSSACDFDMYGLVSGPDISSAKYTSVNGQYVPVKVNMTPRRGDFERKGMKMSSEIIANETEQALDLSTTVHDAMQVKDEKCHLQESV